MEGSKDQDFNTFYSEVSCDSCMDESLQAYIHIYSVHWNEYVLSCPFQVKAIEKRDSVLTSEQQINRLLRPGSTYFNLNPFEVLQVDPETNLDEIKTKFKRVRKSLLGNLVGFTDV